MLRLEPPLWEAQARGDLWLFSGHRWSAWLGTHRLGWSLFPEGRNEFGGKLTSEIEHSSSSLCDFLKNTPNKT